MSIQGNHQFENFTNNGQANIMPRAFDAKGNPVQLIELDSLDLEDLAQFNNVQQNAMMDVTGTHMIKNINTGAKSQTNFNDHKDGQFATVMNANNGGQMRVSGNHVFDNTVNNGQLVAAPRQFGLLELNEDFELEDLAAFNNYNNLEGGMTQIQGTHQF